MISFIKAVWVSSVTAVAVELMLDIFELQDTIAGAWPVVAAFLPYVGFGLFVGAATYSHHEWIRPILPKNKFYNLVPLAEEVLWYFLNEDEASPIELKMARTKVVELRYKLKEIDVPLPPLQGRVGRWRGALRVRCTGPRAFASASIPVPIRSVSTPRSSNRTCGTTAFGSQLGSRLRPRKVPGLRRKAREAAFLPQPRVGKAHVFPRPHLVLPPEPLS